MPWYVIYTKSNAEKQVLKGLQKRNINVYCPMRRTKRKWSDRTKFIDTPLFRSYCFVQLDESERGSVFGVPGVVGYLNWLQKPAIVRDEEIEQIRRMLNEFDHDSIEVESYTIADKVQVLSGSFIEHQGTVVAVQGKKIILQLDEIQLRVVLDMNKTMIGKQQNK